MQVTKFSPTISARLQIERIIPISNHTKWVNQYIRRANTRKHSESNPIWCSIFFILPDEPDEVTDASNREQLSLVIRFVDSDGNIDEEFLGFQNLRRITGEAMASSILDTLPQWNLDIKNCRGQGYDGASNMSSSRRGTQALILEKSPKDVYTHYRAHCLNLTIVHPCDHPLSETCLEHSMKFAIFLSIHRSVTRFCLP